VWAVAFSIFFFFLIVLVLLNWGLMKLRPFKLLIFLWLEALNFDDNFFFWALLKKIWALNFFFFGPINFFFWGGLNMPGALGERLARLVV
jgi:hypothetical protein